MKIVKYANEDRRELGLNEKGDITELFASEYVIRFDDKEEYEKAKPIIMEAAKLGFDVYRSQTTSSKLVHDSECGMIYSTNGISVTLIENKKSHELKDIIRKIMMTVK